MHRGRVVKRTGDGSVVEVRSVVDAVRCAIEVQSGLAERDAGLPPEKRIEFRVGIHVGDIVEESDGDLMGEGVNIAARLEGICEPNEIMLSGAAHEHARDRLKEAFVDLRREGIEKHRPAGAGVCAEACRRGAGTRCSCGEIQPASPFDRGSSVREFGGRRRAELFRRRRHRRSLTTDLSQMSGMLVIGRNTAFSYKGKAVDLKRIGRELNVRYVLEGSVQRSASRMRVNVQLIDAESGNHLWADRFDKPVADLFDMQDEIVARLANALNAQLIIAEARRAGGPRVRTRWTSVLAESARTTKRSPQTISQRPESFSSALWRSIPATSMRSSAPRSRASCLSAFT